MKNELSNEEIIALCVGKEFGTLRCWCNPDLREMILECNKDNRPIGWGKVDRLDEAMVNGDWMFNGDTIRFGWNGRLLDGQTRLEAMRRSGKTVEILLVYGLDPACFKTIDLGGIRTMSDILAILKYKNTKLLASAGIWLWRYNENKMCTEDGKRLNQTPTKPQQLLYIERHQELIASVDASLTVTGLFKHLQPSIGAFLFHIFREACAAKGKTPNAHVEFLNAIASGVGLEERDPRLLLRNKLSEIRSMKSRLDYHFIIALAIKAWNAWRAGARPATLRWHNGGAKSKDGKAMKREPFPTAV